MRIYLWALLGCGLLAAGCSSGTDCQKACEKQNSCAASLDCTKYAAGSDQSNCLWAKKTYVTGCSAITTCGPTEKTAAQKMLSCQLDSYCKDCTAGDSGPRSDILCHRPPTIFSCFAPPNNHSTNLWYCSGCGECGSGTPSIAACSLLRGDCRYFADGCIPQEYWPCDGTGTDQLQFLCGSCFFSPEGGLLRGDAGAARLATCNKLPDGSTSTPVDAGKKQ
jgi:hypothetical protein